MKKREKIAYDDALADAIIAANGLRPEAKKVWKSRGHIPGDYLDENRDESAKINDRDPEYQRIREILGRPEIASSKFRSLAQKGVDVQRGKDRMTEAERLGFKTELIELRNKIRLAKDAPTQRNLLAALTDIRLHPTKIVPPALYDRIRRNSDLYEYEKKEAQFCLLALYNILRI